MELKQLELSLLRAEDVQAYTEDLAATIKSRLSALPGRLAMDVVNLTTASEISEVIEKEVNGVLTLLSEYEFSLDFYKERISEDKGKNLTIEDGDDVDD